MSKDDFGTDFLAAKIVIMLIVASLLSVILLSGLSDLLGAYSATTARAEAQKVSEFARLAYSTDCVDVADDRSISVSIPASVRRVAFGAIPCNETPARMDRSYYIEYADGSTETYVSEVPFANYEASGPVDEPVLIYPGDYVLKASPVSLNGSIKAGLSVEVA